MQQNPFDPKILIAVVLLGVVVLLVLFSEFLLPLAIILVPIILIFAGSQLKKKT